MLSYGALFFQISATCSSLILIDRLAELPFRSSRQWHLQVERKENPSTIPGTSSQLMKRHRGGVVWSFMKWHCGSIFISLDPSAERRGCFAPTDRVDITSAWNVFCHCSGHGVHLAGRTTSDSNCYDIHDCTGIPPGALDHSWFALFPYAKHFLDVTNCLRYL